MNEIWIEADQIIDRIESFRGGSAPDVYQIQKDIVTLAKLIKRLTEVLREDGK